MKKILLIVTLILSFNAFAGQDKGGGMVIKVQDKYSLFDFYENGLENTAALSQRNNPDQWNLTRLLTVTLNNDPIVAHEIVNKLFDVYEKNIHFGYVLYKEFFSSYSIKIVNSDLIETKDIGVSPVVPPPGSIIYQAAIRDDREKIVWINAELWNKLTLEHKVGLIFHEAIYALFVLKRGDISSSSSRALTAYIFDPAFDFQTPVAFHQRLAGYFRQLFIDSEPILTNKEAIEFDIVNNFAKLKNEIFDHALFFDHYGKIWNEQINKEIKKLESTICGKNNRTKSTWPGFSRSYGYPYTYTVTYNGQIISPFANEPSGWLHWRCVLKKGIFGDYQTKEGDVQVISKEDLELIKVRIDRLSFLRSKFRIGVNNTGKDALLSNDPQFEGLLFWLANPKSRASRIASEWDKELF